MRKTDSLLLALIAIFLLPSDGVSQQPVRWESSLEAAQRLAGQTNRLVLIQFGAPWCPACKQMEAEVLNQPAVARDIGANYVGVKINADNFPATAQQYGVTGLPTTVVTTPQGQMVHAKRGRVEAGEYVAQLNRTAAEAKQRSAAANAQLQGRNAPPMSVAAATPQRQPNSILPPTNLAPPMENRAPLVPGMQSPTINQPVANQPIANQPIANQPIANQPAAAPAAASDSRFAGLFRQNEPAPQGPIPQPSPAMPGSTLPQMTTNQGPVPQTAMAPTGATAPGMGQPPVAAPVGPIYAGQPAPQQPAVPQMSGQQAPTINPPLALDGFCPVLLVEKHQWTPGDRQWGATHRGRTYLFAGPEEQRRFLADPDRYAPAASGNDLVVAVEEGREVAGLREHGVFFGNNRVYLFASEASLEKFSRNPHQYVNQSMSAFRTGSPNGQQLQ